MRRPIDEPGPMPLTRIEPNSITFEMLITTDANASYSLVVRCQRDGEMFVSLRKTSEPAL